MTWQPSRYPNKTTARRRRLTFYDAIYLELAKHAGATLATLDRALLQAASAERVPTIET